MMFIFLCKQLETMNITQLKNDDFFRELLQRADEYAVQCA